MCKVTMFCCCRSDPEVIKLFSCSTQLNMNFFLLVKVKMPTIVGILTFMIAKNSILGLSEACLLVTRLSIINSIFTNWETYF